MVLANYLAIQECPLPLSLKINHLYKEETVS
jgi:hypothetical protein